MGEEEKQEMEENFGKVDDGARFIPSNQLICIQILNICIDKGTWWHFGFHLTTSTMVPPLLSLRTLSSSEDGLPVYRVLWEKHPSRFSHTAFSPYVLFSGKHMEIDVLNFPYAYRFSSYF
ncbi:unnamed protein product [Brassica rapa subsp. trilocularis]